ncbi:uncharacterized protein TNCT_636262 [Trichonephila clavata]|uniref:Uncharacterized protein n=1 Tax=Trichonephila clavata TaxID=2740835 RepID=A0A8X6J113_TRICU|nr:uncharacterized protein TNCT_636262 [Trichonephila clavata]
MRKFLTATLVIALMQITYIACKETDDIQISDPGAEDCRRQLNNCLDQVEDRIAGVFDMDYCCDEYKKCMYKLGRNRP